MIILGKSVLTLLNIPRRGRTRDAVAPILTSGAIQRSQAGFVNAGRTRKICGPSLMPLIGQLPQYSGNRYSRSASGPPVSGRLLF